MTLIQGQDTPEGHKQSLCEIRTSHIYHLEKKMDQTRINLHTKMLTRHKFA